MIRSHLSVIISAVIIMISAAGCGPERLRLENADGTSTVIEYDSASPFERAPLFEADGGTVSMRFNGRTWYTARIISAAEAKQYLEGIIIAESSNLRAVRTADGSFDYAYIMDLQGTEDSFVLFRTDTGPDSHDYGTDFRTGIIYSVSGIPTVPDPDLVRK